MESMDNNTEDKYISTIRFKYTYDTHGYLSNFCPSNIVIDGVMYRHVEGYYQSQKFVGYRDDIATRIARTINPMDCKRLSREYEMDPKRKEEWNNGLRDAIMRRGVLCKFLMITSLRDKLLSTGNTKLVECASYDNYWADGGDGSGLNMLGKILMETREILRTMTF